MVTVTREQLYTLIWSEPAMKVAKVFGVSGPGLAKACRRHGIPVPERGYWARLAAGKKVVKRPLLPRGLGMPPIIRLGGDRYGYRVPESELDPDCAPPAAPTFAESIDEVRARAVKIVGKVRPQRSLDDSVPAVRQYLTADAERRRKMAESKYYWDTPKFETPVEQRRLRILNSLFVTSLRLGFPGSISGQEARELSVRVGEQHVAFKLDAVGHNSIHRAGPGRPPKDATRLSLEISRREYPGGPLKQWTDAQAAPLERVLSEVLVELLVTGEQFERDAAAYRYQWILGQRERVLEERRQRIAEEERKRVERIEAAKRARLNRLSKDLDAWRRAGEIRAYVAAAEAAHAGRGDRLGIDLLILWAAWARAEADRLDPLAEGRAVFDPSVPELEDSARA